MSIIILPLLSFIAARGGAKVDNFENNVEFPIRALNGTELILGCGPAELFVRQHMAPDFESPQLVRRLDWFHDDNLVASYQQVIYYQC